MDTILFNESKYNQLSERQRAILQSIIHYYILSASPIGSRSLSKLLERELKLSPATIRNIMSDLEEMNFISHPHTSAGRIPTDKGYRYYVDSLMKIETLSELEIKAVQENITGGAPDAVLRDASRVLGLLSRYLGVVEIPHLIDLSVQKLELISLSSTRLLVVLALDSNIVRTLTLEAEFEIDRLHLEQISQLLNDKITGKPIRFLKENFNELIADSELIHTPLVRLFIESVDKIFEHDKERIHIAGTPSLLEHPEFDDLKKVRGIIELIENEDIIVHIMDKAEASEAAMNILIGTEFQNELLEDYSMVASKFHIGSAVGAIGLIGPKRMNYSKIISLVGYVAELLSKNL
jgi:heat-inducible transcriptional repressor